MRKELYITSFLMIGLFSCQRQKSEPKVSFYDEAKLRLEKAINLQDGGIRLQELDTIFTAKINGTDSIFMIGYKFVILAKNQRKLNCEYIYKNLHNVKKELLISTLSETSIEEGAKEIQEKTGGSYYDAVFTFAATNLEIKGNDLQ